MAQTSIVSRLRQAGRALISRDNPPAAPEVISATQGILAQVFTNNKALANPDKVLMWEAGAIQYDLYKDMLDKDAIIGHLFETRVNELLSSSWEIKPFVDPKSGDDNPTPAAQEQADLIKRIFTESDKTSLDRLLDIAFKDALSCGFSVTEPIWAVNPRSLLIEPIDFRARDQNRIQFGPQWELQLKPDFLQTEVIDLPEWRFLLMRRGGGANNPYGEGLCRSLYWGFYVKKLVAQFWAIYQERFATPILGVKYKRGLEADTALQNAVEDILDKYGNAAGIQYSEDIELELLEAKRASQTGYKDFIQYWDQAHTKRVLGQTLTSGEGEKSGSSQALGNVHMKVADDVLRRDATFVSRAINTQLIRTIIDINFGEVAGYPKLEFDVDPPEDLEVKGRVYDQAQKSGLTIGVEHYRKEFKIPPPAEDEEILEPLSGGVGIMPDPNQGEEGRAGQSGDGDSGKKTFSESALAGSASRRFYFFETTRSPANPALLKSRQRVGKIRAPRGVIFMCNVETNVAEAVRFDSKIIKRASAIDFMTRNFAEFAGKQPPPGVELIQMSSTFHLHDPFRQQLEEIFSTMEPEIANLLETNAPLRAAIEQLVKKKIAIDLNRRLPKVNEDAIRFGAEVFGQQLSVVISPERFDRYVNEYLDIHAFQPESNRLSPVANGIVNDTRDRLTARSRKIVKDFKDGKLELEEAVDKITTEFKDVKAWKARQVAVTEVNEAASFASFKIIEDTGLRFDAYFLVDPISCQVCLEQAARNPYSVDAAKLLGLPHPNCNDFWAFVPTNRDIL